MLHRLFTVVSAVSLVLCLAACALWIRSYRHLDMVNGDVANAKAALGEWSAVSVRGLLELQYDQITEAFQFKRPRLFRYEGYPNTRFSLWDQTSHFGFGYISSNTETDIWVDPDRERFEDGSIGGSGSYLRGASHKVIFPDYAVVVITLALPLTWVSRKWRRQRRKSAFACLQRGYDLRATPHRCPECGTEAKRTT